MTVGELMEELNKYPSDMKVVTKSIRNMESTEIVLLKENVEHSGRVVFQQLRIIAD